MANSGPIAVEGDPALLPRARSEGIKACLAAAIAFPTPVNGAGGKVAEMTWCRTVPSSRTATRVDRDLAYRRRVEALPSLASADHL